MLRRVVKYKLTYDSEVFTASVIRAMMIVLMMEAVITFETSVNFNQTTRHNIA
jgi:hypothetical protein